MKSRLNLLCKYAYTTILLVYAIYNVSAQTDTATFDNNMEDVVVTGQYGQNSLTRSVYKVKVIDSKRIQLQGAVNLKDVLVNELNIRVANDPALGSSLSIQGLGGQNIKIMIDGVPVVGREGGSIDLTQLNLANIERIEYVEGPMSVNFGTDALGGVINLITMKQTKPQARTTFYTYAETIGQANVGVSNNVSNGRLNTQINVNRNFFGGFHTDPDSRYKMWKPRTQYFGDFNLGLNLKKMSLRWQNTLLDESVTNRGIATITPWYANAKDEYYYTRRFTSGIFINKHFSKNYNADFVANYSHYRRIRNSYQKDLVTLNEVLIPQSDMQDTAYSTLWMSRGTFARSKAQSNFNFQSGYEINYEQFEGKRIIDSKQQIADVNAFFSSEWKPINRITLRPALRYIYNTKFNAPLVPSLNIKWDVNSLFTLRASYGRGYRAPTLKELYLNFVDPSHNVQGNPNLQAETQDNYQLNGLLEWNKFERIFRIEPSLFYNDVKNKIDLALMNSSTLEARYFNISQFRSVGANLTTEYRAPHYRFMLGYAYTGLNNSFAGQTANPFFFSHEWRFNFNYTFDKRGLTLACFYKYNSKLQLFQYDVTTGKNFTGFIDAYQLLDVTANKLFFSKRLNMTVGLKNIFNVSNIAANIAGGIHSAQSNAAMIGMGRTAFVSVQYQIDWKK